MGKAMVDEEMFWIVTDAKLKEGVDCCGDVVVDIVEVNGDDDDDNDDDSQPCQSNRPKSAPY